MCIGIPMRVVESGPFWAWCVDDGDRQKVDMRLVGPQPPGAWVLVFHGAAREAMGEARALRIRDALRALGEAAAGRRVDDLFADLVEREPQLPAFLKKP